MEFFEFIYLEKKKRGIYKDIFFYIYKENNIENFPPVIFCRLNYQDEYQHVITCLKKKKKKGKKTYAKLIHKGKAKRERREKR